MSDNAGWLKKMLVWDWTDVVLAKYQGWQIDMEQKRWPDRTPAFVKLTHVRRSSRHEVESRVLCVAWDDVAEVRFYQRDWTDDGIPFVRDGDTYWSGWWFQTCTDRDRFLEWLKSKRKYRKLYVGIEA